MIAHSCKTIPIVFEAVPQIRINGKPLESMDNFRLKPNDRIAIGPTALFLYKNKKFEHEASMPDTEEDPISFDFASEEVIEADNEG